MAMYFKYHNPPAELIDIVVRGMVCGYEQKGHTTSELADMAISGDGDTCCLASLTKDGELFVWELNL